MVVKKMGAFINLTGQKFTRLTALKRIDNYKNQVMWECKCDCGKTIRCSSESLRSGNTRSCGCLIIKHGETHTRLYSIHRDMKKRCDKPYCNNYKNYGARGIKICPEWYDYEVFAKWAYESGYKDNLTLERKDVNGNYCPENCTWVTKQEQLKNTRKTHFVVYKGKKMCMSDLERLTKVSRKAIIKYEKEFAYDYDAIIEKILNSKHHIQKRHKGGEPN